MKTINVTFEDEEIKKLEDKKEGLSWREFILKIADVSWQKKR